jgi:hypothetical protein
MFDIKPELNLANIYKKISEESIIYHIIPNIKKRGFSIRNEKNASAHLREYRGKLYIKDFGDSTQNKSETWYQYIARLNGWNCNDREGFLKSLNWANEEFKLGLRMPFVDPTLNYNNNIISNINHESESHYESKNRVKLEIRICKWTKEHLDYWMMFGISISQLKEKNIFPIDYYWITNPSKNNRRIRIDCTKKLTFVYVYYEDEGVFMYKIYSPLDEFKWISNVNCNVIENWRFIKIRKPNLIIQSSLKDIMVMEFFRDNYNIFKDYDIISPISEGIWFKSWDLIRSNYNNIIYYGNNDWNKKDNPGLAYAKKWSELYSIPYIINPDWCKASDISDFRRDNGEIKTKELLIKLENDCSNRY